jgi:hypothetical protein
MQSTSRIMKVFLMLLLLLASGCASDRPPSGGPADTTPLKVLFSDPAPSAVNVSANRILLTFNHDITVRQLLNALVISPPISNYDLAVDGKTVEIRGFKPLEQNKTYIITIDKNLRNYRGNSIQTPCTIAFSTGAVIDSGIISGKVINTDCTPASNALLLAFAEHPENQNTGNLLQREPDYFIQAENSGIFSFRHIAPGSYRIIAVNDRNSDLRFNPATEETGISSKAVIPAGSSDLLFRLSGIQNARSKPPAEPLGKEPASTETGGITGTCFASGQYVIVEASSLKASYRTTASRDRDGTFHYSFTELPPGSYTISSFMPSSSKKPDLERQWNPGSLEPFQPSEPFGFYPDKVTVRPRWTTEHIDIHIITSR